MSIEQAISDVRVKHMFLLMQNSFDENKFHDFLNAVENYKTRIALAQPGENEMYDITRTLPEFQDIYRVISETNRFVIPENRLQEYNDLYNEALTLYTVKSMTHMLILAQHGQAGGKRKRTRKVHLRKKKSTRRYKKNRKC